MATGLRTARVAVLLGGTSSEREISLASGAAVLEALRAEDGRGPAAAEPVELGADGSWSAGARTVPFARAAELLAGFDACFLALHGGAGEDGRVQGFLDLLGLAYTGSGPGASALCMDKWAARAVAARAGLLVAPGGCFSRETWGAEAARLLDAAPQGVCVKPRRGGSSVGTARARTPEELERAALAVLEHGDDVLVERWIEGTELTCGVLGAGAAARALPPVEIRPNAGRFFDWEEKYAQGGARELCPPESVAGEAVVQVRRAGLCAHRELGCAGYSRTDFLLPREPGARPVFLETNSLPGLTPRSLLPLAARTAGVDFRTLCLSILGAALGEEVAA